MSLKNENLKPYSASPVVSVIVPARNEEANLERCLRSIASQQGISFELIVANDASTDGTAEIAEKFSRIKECPVNGVHNDLVNVIAINAPPLPAGWTGKANAVYAGAQQASGEWLLFTDADTEHLPDSLSRAVAEARSLDVEMLSYSPAQEVGTLAERVLMPVVFAELATTFKPAEVSDPRSQAAAANGQYLLIRRDAYFAVGAHEAVAAELLEDVALARLVKQSGRKMFFRYGGGQVRTRMYHGWLQLRDGWTKNLALLFPNPERLALKRLAEFLVIAIALLFGIAGLLSHAYTTAAVAFAIALIFGTNLRLRIARAHFDGLSSGLAMFGGPLFAYVLLRSVEAHRDGAVEWKGRAYGHSVTNAGVVESILKSGN